MNEFNKQLLYNNIEQLLKKRGLGVGDFEKNAGVSTGYMARSRKDEKSKPGIEFIMAAAQLLGISVDALLSMDISRVTPTEQYLMDFLSKLEKDTCEDKLDWKRESAEYLNHLESDSYGNSEHPLFREETFTEILEEYPEQMTETVFTSKNYYVHTAIHNDCFNLRLKNDATLYVMDISKGVYREGDPDAFCREIWMWIPEKGAEYLCDNRSDNLLSFMVDSLYWAISEYIKHPKIGAEYMNVIDAYMKEGLSDDCEKKALPLS